MTATTPLRVFSVYSLLFAVLLAAAPHAVHLPKWVLLLAASLWLWRVHLLHRDLRLPNRWLLSLFTIAGSVGIFFHYRSLFGRDAGVTLLVLMLALKLLEMNGRRDAIMVIFLSYLLLITHFLYSQTVATAAYMLAVVWLITMTMVGFQQREPQQAWKSAVRTSGLLLTQAVPLMLVMFLFFPRVQGPLWGLPQDAYSGSTGLSDTMSPGSLSNLSLSDAVAFRARFEAEPPNHARLYWRGPVLWDFDGKAWRAGSAIAGPVPDLLAAGDAVRYAVTVEAHQQNWLFALDLPALTPEASRITPDFQILQAKPVRERKRYEMLSYLSYRIAPQSLPRETRERALQLPPAAAPRARALAERIRAEAGSDEEVLQRTLEFFTSRPFFYTLSPPLLGSDPVDEFLFQTQRGFCEHYASAFVFLMRAAGVPARVLTGYHGGTLNPVGDYVIVRQADAHAWAEVWLESRGWVRVDPTATVAPQRLVEGLAAAVPADDPVPLLARDDVAWLRHALYRWDAIANAWNQWVLGYNPERQRSFLARVGFDDATWHTMAMALLGMTSLVLVALAGLLLFNLRAQHSDPVQTAWQRFCRKLARRGAARHPTEGPRDYAQRIAQQFPEVAEDVRTIGELYIRLRYGKRARPDDLQRLKTLVIGLRI
jgi:transglutaminase-like putative cysteine protease